jgi:hypothetical protein
MRKYIITITTECPPQPTGEGALADPTLTRKDQDLVLDIPESFVDLLEVIQVVLFLLR